MNLLGSQSKAVQKQTAQYDLFNRLHSIASDEAFVKRIANHYGYQVVANQRCGTWYCDPSSSSSTYAYFKSTDGHTNNWAFNLRRSNLPFAEWAECQGGVILVDSTRRGKRMPDALSKTVPIWCAVINRAVSAAGEGCELYLPPSVVSDSERAQIEARIGGWVEALMTSTLSLPKLSKPLRPFWVHPGTTQPPFIPPDPAFTPIICLSASRWVGSEDDVPAMTRLGASTVGFSYVQGAGDDDELWSRGLTPGLYHKHKTQLLREDRDDLPGALDDLCSADLSLGLAGLQLGSSTTGVPGPESRLALSIGDPIYATSWQPTGPVHTLRVCTLDKPRKGEPSIYRTSPTSSLFACPSARSHPGAYFHALDALVNHVEDLLDENCSIDIHPTSPDTLEKARNLTQDQTLELEDPPLAPADALEARRTILPLALVLSLAIPDLSSASNEGRSIDKGVIADSLHQLVAQWPDGNPPRAALRRVNEYLMSVRQ